MSFLCFGYVPAEKITNTWRSIGYSSGVSRYFSPFPPAFTRIQHSPATLRDLGPPFLLPLASLPAAPPSLSLCVACPIGIRRHRTCKQWQQDCGAQKPRDCVVRRLVIGILAGHIGYEPLTSPSLKISHCPPPCRSWPLRACIFGPPAAENRRGAQEVGRCF